MPGAAPTSPPRPVPVRAIATTIAMVLGTLVTVFVLWKLARIISWLVVAGFIALILNPAVEFFHRRLHLRRSLAILLTFLVGVTVLAAMMYAFIRPLVQQANHFADNFPTYVEDAKAGRGPVGKIVTKYKVDRYIQKNQSKFKAALASAGKPAANIARKVASTAAALVTIVVLAFLMLSTGPGMLASALNALPEEHRQRVTKVAGDSAKAVSGYVAGNLLISVIASVITFVSLWILHVPFRAVLALWVFFADLIPLVGATLGAIPAVLVAALASPIKGLIMIGIFVAYQQFENHVLQVSIMAKTVKLNPLAVLVSVLIGVDLFGFLGALLAIPVAGIIQVIVRDVWDHRRGRPKPEPTVGVDEVPVPEVVDEEHADGDAAREEGGAREPAGEGGRHEPRDDGGPPRLPELAPPPEPVLAGGGDVPAEAPAMTDPFAAAAAERAEERRQP